MPLKHGFEGFEEIPVITPDELYWLLENVLKPMENPPALMVYGPPGVGKTYILNDFAKRNNYEIRVKHLSRMDPSDWSGIPREINIGDNIYTTFLPPDLFKPSDRRLVLFFDELNTATPQVLNAALDVILEKKSDVVELPKNTIIVAAGNLGIMDGTYVEELSTAVKTRLIQVILFYSPSEWLKWARKNSIHRAVIAFIEKHRNEMSYLLDLEGMRNRVQQVATPRGWHRVSDVLKISGFAPGVKVSVLEKIISGLIGDKVASKFVEFLQNEYSLLNKNLEKLKFLIKIYPSSMEEWEEVIQNLESLLELVDAECESGNCELAEQFTKNIFGRLKTASLRSFYGTNFPNYADFLRRNYPALYRRWMERDR